MECSGCGNTLAYRIRIGNGYCLCDRCDTLCGNTGVPDVYFPGVHFSENIVDANGKPIEFRSRRHKAEVMKEQGISEAGDRVHGSYIDNAGAMVRKSPSNSKEIVRQALEKAKIQMKRKYG